MEPHSRQRSRLGDAERPSLRIPLGGWAVRGPTGRSEEVTEEGSDLNAILEASFVEPDTDKRQELLAQAQEIIVRDAVRIPVFDNVNSESGYFAYSSKLQGLRENSISELVLYDAWLTS